MQGGIFVRSEVFLNMITNKTYLVSRFKCTKLSWSYQECGWFGRSVEHAHIVVRSDTAQNKVFYQERRGPRIPHLPWEKGETS